MSTHSTRMTYLGTQRPQIKARAGGWAALQAMVMAWRTRRVLAKLDDRMLADIGVGRGDAMMEAARPIWDIEPGTLR